MKLAKMTVVGCLSALLALPVMAETGPGMGRGGQGPGMTGGMGPQNGMGKNAGRGMRFSQDNTSGWALMSAEERSAHQGKMLAAKSYDECKAIQVEHHQAMLVKAKEQGKTLPAPRQNGCDRMKSRGYFK